MPPLRGWLNGLFDDTKILSGKEVDRLLRRKSKQTADNKELAGK